ncbi:hypothetical protein ACOMHN_034395 [Nucella lapillus]
MLITRKKVTLLAALALAAVTFFTLLHHHHLLTSSLHHPHPHPVHKFPADDHFLPPTPRTLPSHHPATNLMQDRLVNKASKLTLTKEAPAVFVVAAPTAAPVALPVPVAPSPKKKKKKKKKVVYVCSGVCGGWADRQKGIVGAYVLASLLGRDFGIHITVPCDLSRFMDVGKVNWKVNPAELRGPGNKVRTYKPLDQVAVDFAKTAVSRNNLDEHFPHDVSAITWNMEVVQYLQKHRLASEIGWLAGGRPFSEVYKQALDDLFVLKPDLQNQLDQLQKSRPPHTKLVCAQIRLGMQNRAFPDSLTLHSFEDFTVLVKFLSKYNDSSQFRIFFSSDSIEIMQKAKSEFPEVYLDIPGPITHTDKSKGADACQGFQKAIVDEYALASCDVLVISESGLGKIASFMRGTDKELYLFHWNHVDPFTRLGVFPNKDGW